MADTTKVTVALPSRLLTRAQRSTRQGVTATIRRGLELVAAAQAAEELRGLRGTVTFTIKLDRLREDGR